MDIDTKNEGDREGEQRQQGKHIGQVCMSRGQCQVFSKFRNSWAGTLAEFRTR